MSAVVSPRDLVPRMRELRAEGHAAPAIGRILGIPESTIRNWWNAGACIDCGEPTERSSGAACKRCATCAAVAFGVRSREATYWTDERIIEAIRCWADEHGEPPSIPDWEPRTALRIGDLQRARRAETLRAGRSVPAVKVVYYHFGSWNAAIEAAGFTPRAAHGGDGNQFRRRSTRKPSAVPLEAASPTEGMRP